MIRLQIIPSADGRDRWAIIRHGSIVFMWTAPRCLSFGSRLRGY